MARIREATRFPEFSESMVGFAEHSFPDAYVFVLIVVIALGTGARLLHPVGRPEVKGSDRLHLGAVLHPFPDHHNSGRDPDDDIYLSRAGAALICKETTARVFNPGRRDLISPMTPAASPIAATTKQQHQNNDNEDQFHSKSPVR